ncbi:uncharacterized protein LOC131879308 [Tigriopus californicus]|uniref:uncharacterized protein LOC131879308 n=1 Tax=Tigriopus californicus TaxID=6832 RepID=UPI0027DA9134|nr:uncharacterized protein LOC131879308 [Tigriopus californicus]|eukprot:TCALIF_05520-PA protein Name:"Protein of unknown function" AED:0.01 eAED:0.01 QI:33/1/0.66/1/1/1/3/0/156
MILNLVSLVSFVLVLLWSSVSGLSVVKCRAGNDGGCIGFRRPNSLEQTMATPHSNLPMAVQKKNTAEGLTREEILDMIERLKRYIPVEETRTHRADRDFQSETGPTRTHMDNESGGILNQFVQTLQAANNYGARFRSKYNGRGANLVTLNHLIRGI